MNIKGLLLFFTLCFALNGCGGEQSSEGTATNELHGYYWVKAYGDGTTQVTARFTTTRVIDGFFPDTKTVRLEGGDNLSVSANGISKDFSIDPGQSNITYITEFDFDSGPTEFVFQLDRPSRSETITSQIELPPGMEMLSPLEGDIYTDSGNIDIMWTPTIPSKKICICFTTECFQQGSSGAEVCNCAIDDNGLYTTSISEFVSGQRFDLITKGSCTAKVSISRTNTADIRGGLPGDIQSSQTRSSTITIDL